MLWQVTQVLVTAAKRSASTRSSLPSAAATASSRATVTIRACSAANSRGSASGVRPPVPPIVLATISSSAIRLASTLTRARSSSTTERTRLDIVSPCRPMRDDSSALVSGPTCSGGRRCQSSDAAPATARLASRTAVAPVTVTNRLLVLTLASVFVPMGRPDAKVMPSLDRSRRARTRKVCASRAAGAHDLRSAGRPPTQAAVGTPAMRGQALAVAGSMQTIGARQRTQGNGPLHVVSRRAPARRRRWSLALGSLCALLACAVVAAGTYAVLVTRAPPPVEPEGATVTVTAGPVIGTVSLSGRLDFERTVRVGSSASGQIVAMRAGVGELVRRGQVLARLDDLEQRTAVDTADVQRTLADIQLPRAELRLLESAGVAAGGSPAVPLEELLASADPDAQLAAMAAVAQLTRQKALFAFARGQLARRMVRAPEDGVVVGRGFERGETVVASPPGPPLFVLDVRPGHLALRVALDERYVARVEAGPVRVTVPSRARNMVGEVLGVTAPDGLSSATSGPVQYQVDIAVDNVDETLRPGLSASVDLPMSSAKSTLRVPMAAVERAAAIRGAPGTTPAALWVVDGAGRTKPVAVTLGSPMDTS